MASSGGAQLAIPGRVGPAAIVGASLFVGVQGAVGVSGFGEKVLREQLARAGYAELELHGFEGARSWARAARELDPGLTIALLDAKNTAVFAPDDVAWEQGTSATVEPLDPIELPGPDAGAAP